MLTLWLSGSLAGSSRIPGVRAHGLIGYTDPTRGHVRPLRCAFGLGGLSWPSYCGVEELGLYSSPERESQHAKGTANH
ncbi:MAG TPA: hypothetical protein VF844_05770 [Ktedonobacteraceae bacterium]